MSHKSWLLLWPHLTSHGEEVSITSIIDKKETLLVKHCVPNKEYCQQKTKECSSSPSANSIDVLFWSSAPRWSFFRLLSRFQKVNKFQFGKAKKGALYGQKTSFSNPTWMPWQYSLFALLLSPPYSGGCKINGAGMSGFTVPSDKRDLHFAQSHAPHQILSRKSLDTDE